MKIKFQLLSLQIFVLFLLAIFVITDKSNTTKMNNLNLEMKKISNHERESIFSTRNTLHSSEIKKKKVMKTEGKVIDKKNEEMNSKEELEKPQSGFFSRTKKSNQSIAGKALGAFVLGIVLFICSIHLTCWNERRAVKETEYIDHIRNEKKCIFLENGKESDDKSEDENKVYIVNGQVTVQREAQIEGLPLNITTSKGNILVIKTQFEKFSLTETVKDKEVGEDDDGNTLVERENVTYRNWFKTEYKGNKFSTNFYYGDAQIAGRYKFPMKNLKSQIELSQTKLLEDNNYIYRPTINDIPALEDYFKTENNDPDKPYKIIVKDPWIFILRSKIPTDDNFDLNPDTYEFSESDIRMTIKYYFIPTSETFFTAVGKLSKADENGLKSISPFETNLHKAGCNYFCCCCVDADEKYVVDLLYTSKMNREEIVKKLENENDACTWCLRLTGFLMHFAGIYLILYPLILLVSYIPIIGAVGATVLVIFAFILAMMTFLFIIAMAWICARPIYSIIIFGLIFILFFVGKTTKDHIDSQDNNSRGGYQTNSYDNGYNESKNKNNFEWPHRKFLKF